MSNKQNAIWLEFLKNDTKRYRCSLCESDTSNCIVGHVNDKSSGIVFCSSCFTGIMTLAIMDKNGE